MLRKILLIISLLPFMLQAQITAPGSVTARMTNYPDTQRDDPVYIFCTDDVSDRAALTAESPGGISPFTFTWMRYDQTVGTFSVPVMTETGLISAATGLIEGGYSVNITGGGGYDTTLYAWVSLDKPVSNAALKDRTCEMVALDGTYATDNFYYYDPSSNVSRLLPNAAGFRWSSTPASSIPNPTLDPDPITYDPPLVDVEYMFQVTDNFGCVSSSSFDYVSIHVKAAFVAEPVTGEAPLEVMFTNNSIRAASYLWSFGDDSISTEADPDPHTYYIPDKYDITLSIESDLFCSDDTTITITVEPSALNIPNVFSPNDDGTNDYFLPEKKSLKYINVQIFAKSGNRVYHFEGNGEAIQNWTGWDGKINNSGRYAEPGVYFYIIRAVGYDEMEYKGKEYRDALYLFR